MNQARLEIDQLLLRIPGMSRVEAEQLGHDVGGLLAELMPANVSPRRVAALKLSVRIDRHTSKQLLARRIAEQICEGLR